MLCIPYKVVYDVIHTFLNLLWWVTPLNTAGICETTRLYTHPIWESSSPWEKLGVHLFPQAEWWNPRISKKEADDLGGTINSPWVIFWEGRGCTHLDQFDFNWVNKPSSYVNSSYLPGHLNSEPPPDFMSMIFFRMFLTFTNFYWQTGSEKNSTHPTGWIPPEESMASSTQGGRFWSLVSQVVLWGLKDDMNNKTRWGQKPSYKWSTIYPVS